MNKFYLTVCFCLSFLLFLSCERPDLTDDVEWAYDYAYDYYNCTEGAFRCNGDMLQKCNSNMWKNYRLCESDQICNAGTGECDPKGDSSDSENSCTKIDGYTWSPKASSMMTWHDAVSYCDNLTECGYSNWHLPTISELRTLIQNCSGTVTGGSCGVTDSCLSFSSCYEESCYSCSYDESGGYSKLGDTSEFWSSSVLSDYSSDAWGVVFYDGHVYGTSKGSISHVRCVR